MKADYYMVVFDDEMGLCANYTANPECAGGIMTASPTDAVILFPTRAAARKAINVSAAFARLQQLQGLAINEDFTTYRKHVQIVPTVISPA